MRRPVTLQRRSPPPRVPLARAHPHDDRVRRRRPRRAPRPADLPQGPRRRQPAADRPAPVGRAGDRDGADRARRAVPAARLVAPQQAPRDRARRGATPGTRDGPHHRPGGLRGLRGSPDASPRPRRSAPRAGRLVSGSFVSPELRTRVRGLAEPIGRGMARLGLSPNAITVIGFGIACLAAVAAAAGAWLLAGILVIFGGVFDMFDGMVARATGKVSKAGAFMDSTFDRWGEGVVYVGLVWGPFTLGSDRPPSSAPPRWPPRSWSATRGHVPRAS